MVTFVGGWLGAVASPSRGPSSPARGGGGAGRASLNFEIFWETRADLIGAEEVGIGSEVTVGGAGGAGCLGGAP